MGSPDTPFITHWKEKNKLISSYEACIDIVSIRSWNGPEHAIL